MVLRTKVVFEMGGTLLDVSDDLMLEEPTEVTEVMPEDIPLMLLYPSEEPEVVSEAVVVLEEERE